MKIYKNTSPEQWNEILKRPVIETQTLETSVKTILDEVSARGDEALFDLTEKYDGVKLSNLLVTPAEFQQAREALSSELKAAITQAKTNIETFHVAQREEPR